MQVEMRNVYRNMFRAPLQHDPSTTNRAIHFHLFRGVRMREMHAEFGGKIRSSHPLKSNPPPAVFSCVIRHPPDHRRPPPPSSPSPSSSTRRRRRSHRPCCPPPIVLSPPPGGRRSPLLLCIVCLLLSPSFPVGVPPRSHCLPLCAPRLFPLPLSHLFTCFASS